MSSFQQKVSKTIIRNWNSLTNTLPPDIFIFCRKALIFSINNTSNLARWKIIDSSNCYLRGKPQMQIHFLNNCTSAINDGKSKWHHDSILKTILSYLTSTNEHDVFTDIEGWRLSAVLFNSSIPGRTIIKDNILYTIEQQHLLKQTFQTKQQEIIL